MQQQFNNISLNAIILFYTKRFKLSMKEMISQFRYEIYDSATELSIPVTRAGIGWQKNEEASDRERGEGGGNEWADRRGHAEKLKRKDVQARS